MKTVIKTKRHLATALALYGVIALTTPAAHAGDSAVKQGETVFNTFCVGCHQAGGVGKPGVAPSLTSPEFLASASDEFLKTTIANGRPGTAMTGWQPVLGDQKIAAVIRYLRSFAKGPSRAAQVNAEPPAKGDVKLGEERYNAVCKGCHGIAGGGYLAQGVAPAIGKPGFLKVASDGYIREIVRHGRSNTRMRGFQGSKGLANLTDQEIDSIISYLRSLNH